MCCQLRSKQEVCQVALQLRAGRLGVACPQTLERKVAGGRVHLPQHFQFAGDRCTPQQVDENLLGLKGSPTMVNRIFPPPIREPGEIIPGGNEDPAGAAAMLADKLTALVQG